MSQILKRAGYCSCIYAGPHPRSLDCDLNYSVCGSTGWRHMHGVGGWLAWVTSSYVSNQFCICIDRV